jgi:hypothetical protein
MVSVPVAGSAGKRSHLYKALKSLNPKVFDKEDNFLPGTNLASFIGSLAVVQVGINTKGFPMVTGLTGGIEGMPSPSLAECVALIEHIRKHTTQDAEDMDSNSGVPF